MTSASRQLRAGLDRLLDGLPPRRASAAVERLIAGYRGRGGPAPVLRDRADAVAYAAYRMPATFEAVSAALGELARRLPGWAPDSHADLGGGTGAAVWAVADTWPGERRTTVLDRSPAALELGRELAHSCGLPVLRATEWRRERIDSASGAAPEADLVTVSYVLGELAEDGRTAVIDAAARAGRAVVVVEPGTPDGYLRVRVARDRLIAAGLRVLAPCPHSGPCPIEVGTDWCHVAARVSRSSLHRQVKGGSLGHEDEKFSYVVAVRGSEGTTGPATARIVRRPRLRKGQVLFELCTENEGLRGSVVSKRDRELYRAARDVSWGDAWPPPGSARRDGGGSPHRPDA